MSVKIKISYTTDKELAGIVRLLSPVVKKRKVSGSRPGNYKRAYIEVDSERLERSEW